MKKTVHGITPSFYKNSQVKREEEEEEEEEKKM